MIFTRLMPKMVPFLDMLKDQNARLCKVSSLSVELFRSPIKRYACLDEISKEETSADILDRKIMRSLSQSFVTPIDREDIFRIAKAQEECIDCLQSLTTRLTTFDVQEMQFPAVRIMEKMDSMFALSTAMLQGLIQKRDAHKSHAFRSLREECAVMLAVGLGELLDGVDQSSTGLGDVIKWVQIYDRIESMLRRVTELFEALEEAVLKNA